MGSNIVSGNSMQKTSEFKSIPNHNSESKNNSKNVSYSEDLTSNRKIHQKESGPIKATTMMFSDNKKNSINTQSSFKEKNVKELCRSQAKPLSGD